MRADRVVSMMLLLERRGRMTAGQLADELGVSRRTVMRDLGSLGEAGVPIYSTRGPGGGFHIWEGFHSQLRSLTADEAAGLSLLGTAAVADQFGLRDATARVRLKLEHALPPELANAMAIIEQRFHHDPTPWGDAGPAKAVAFLAVSVRYRRVVLTNVDATEDVELRPLGLVLKAGEWVLVAEDDGKRRAIAVSRLHGFRSTGARFPYPEDFNLASFWNEIATDGLDR